MCDSNWLAGVNISTLWKFLACRICSRVGRVAPAVSQVKREKERLTRTAGSEDTAGGLARNTANFDSQFSRNGAAAWTESHIALSCDATKRVVMKCMCSLGGTNFSGLSQNKISKQFSRSIFLLLDLFQETTFHSVVAHLLFSHKCTCFKHGRIHRTIIPWIT